MPKPDRLNPCRRVREALGVLAFSWEDSQSDKVEVGLNARGMALHISVVGQNASVWNIPNCEAAVLVARKEMKCHCL
jgi:hypothetical protein